MLTVIHVYHVTKVTFVTYAATLQMTSCGDQEWTVVLKVGM